MSDPVSRRVGFLADRLLTAVWRLPWLVRAAAMAACLTGLWWSSSGPRDAHGENVTRAFFHNGAHVLAFGVVAATGWLLQPTLRCGPLAPVAALGCAILYGLVDELHQRHVPGRSCSVADLLSDSAGAGLAIALLQWRLVRDKRARHAVLSAAIAAVASVCLATWGPW